MIKKLSNYFFTGMFISLPLAITVFLILFLIRNIGEPASDFILKPILAHFDKTVPASGFGGMMVDFLSMLIVVILVAILGVFSQFIAAKFLISLSEKAINKIPFVGVVYKTAKQIVDTFSKQNKAVFQKVALIEFPRKGVWSVGFLTSETRGKVATVSEEKMVNIFVPTTPNPTSGFLMAVPEKDVKYLDMSVGEAMKFIISGGAVSSEESPFNTK